MNRINNSNSLQSGWSTVIGPLDNGQRHSWIRLEWLRWERDLGPKHHFALQLYMYERWIKLRWFSILWWVLRAVILIVIQDWAFFLTQRLINKCPQHVWCFWQKYESKWWRFFIIFFFLPFQLNCCCINFFTVLKWTGQANNKILSSLTILLLWNIKLKLWKLYWLFFSVQLHQIKRRNESIKKDAKLPKVSETNPYYCVLQVLQLCVRNK